MSKLGEKAYAIAGEYYKNKVNCAEAIVKTLDDLCELGIGENVKYASGFGGGIGHSDDICGVVSGSIIVLSAIKGRPNPPEGDRDAMYALSKGFMDIFKEQNLGTTCPHLRKYEWGTRDQRITCLKLIASTAQLLGDYLVDQKLVKDLD